MSKLFEATTIKNMTLPNRFVRSATWEGMAGEDGSCTTGIGECMERLALGGVGLIITGYAFVSREGQAGPRQLGIYEDGLMPAYTEMVGMVHRAGGKIALQIAHGGCHAASELSGLEPVGPSGMMNQKNVWCREMASEEIASTVEAFGTAAARAKACGFDGVQIHGAHGYLLSQFLSPYYNKRCDDYGGLLENRARMLLDVVQCVRESTGNDFPVMVKMNSEDFLEPGLTVEEMLCVAAMLEKAGVDAVELSGGTIFSGKLSPVRRTKTDSEEREVYYRDAARRFKERVGIPLMLVGGIRSYSVAERLVEEGVADYISLSRPLVCEPGLINRWKSGDTSKSVCQSDNLCFRPALKGQGIYCMVAEKARKGQKP